MINTVLQNLNRDIRDLERDFEEATKRLGWKSGFTPFFYRTWSSQRPQNRENQFELKMDVCETPNEYLIVAEVPGLHKNDLQIEHDENKLRIRGEIKKPDLEVKDIAHHMVERTYGTFDRRITLPNNADLKNTRANVEAGLLNLKVPKTEVTSPTTAKNIQIE